MASRSTVQESHFVEVFYNLMNSILFDGKKECCVLCFKFFAVLNSCNTTTGEITGDNMGMKKLTHFTKNFWKTLVISLGPM